MENKRSKSVLFLMELILIIFFFSICSSICLKVFASAKTMSDYSDNLNNACVLAQDGAECYKAYNGDLSKVAEELGGKIDDDTVVVKGDLDLYIVGNEKEANVYVNMSGENDMSKSLFSLKVGNGDK